MRAELCESRSASLDTTIILQRSFVRNFLMHGFHLFLSLLLRPPSPQALLARYLPVKATHTALPAQPLIQDTQCGFKLYTRASARTAFEGMHINRWIFDVEALLRAEMASQTALRRVALRGGMAAVRAKEATGKSAEVGTDSAEDPLLLLPLPIAEVPVEWTEVDGSKIDLLKDSVGMALDLLVIRANYALGRWPRPPPARVDAAETCAR
jgi:dolichyl-phosphate beta-glucosyltransferase